MSSRPMASSSSLPGPSSHRTLEESSLSEPPAPAVLTGGPGVPQLVTLSASSRSLSPARLPGAADSTRSIRCNENAGPSNEPLYSQDDDVSPLPPTYHVSTTGAVDGVDFSRGSAMPTLSVRAPHHNMLPVGNVVTGDWMPATPTEDASRGRTPVDLVDTPDAWTAPAGAPAAVAATCAATVGAHPRSVPVELDRAVTPAAWTVPAVVPTTTAPADDPVVGTLPLAAPAAVDRAAAPGAWTVPASAPAAAVDMNLAVADTPSFGVPVTDGPSSVPVAWAAPTRASAAPIDTFAAIARGPSPPVPETVVGGDGAAFRTTIQDVSATNAGAVTNAAEAPEPAPRAHASENLTNSSTAMECVAFLMRATFCVRNERDQSIFPLLGVAYVVAKFGCLAGILDPARQRVLYATIVELFSSPVNALAFMENTFEVGRGGLNLGGRLTRSRHVSGQPPAFRSSDFNVFLNPDARSTQWLSRSLCVRDGVSFGGSDKTDAGGLSRAELVALSIRLQSHAVVSAASEIGCRVHYCRETSGALAASEIVYTWAFPFDADAQIQHVLQSLRPTLLRSPPQWMTQKSCTRRRPRSNGERATIPRSGQTMTPSASVEGSRSKPTSVRTPARASVMTTDCAALASAVASPPVATAPRDLGSEAVASISEPTDATTRVERAPVPFTSSVPSLALATLSAASTDPSAAARGAMKRTFVEKSNSHARAKALKSSGSSTKGKKPAFAGGSGTSKTVLAGSRAALHVTQMRTCDCASAGSLSGGGSWMVCEVRRSDNSAFLGMAVGVQLPWATDVMNGGRLDIGYTLRSVVPFGKGTSLQYVLNIDETPERSAAPSDTRTTVSQLPSVHANYASLDLAAVVERLCARTYGKLPPPPPLPSTTARGGADRSAGNGAPASSGASSFPNPAHVRAGSPDVSGPFGAGEAVPDPASTTRETPDDLRMVVVDAPADVSPLAVAITLRSPMALSHEHAVSSRVPGRLVLFFPVQVGPPAYAGRC